MIGDSREVNVNGELAGEGLVMKIWPRRLKAKVVCSIDLNKQIDALIDSHCAKSDVFPREKK